MAFITMRGLGLGADIMSLGGIAIAIGAMIDAAIVMIENMHKHLERAIEGKGDGAHSITPAERWEIVVRSSKEVGPALFFSLLIITVSFLPVFTLEAQEGRLFKPLAWTKTLAMAAASLLSITVVPVAMGLFVRGKIHPEEKNPISRGLKRLYRPVLDFVLRNRWPVVAGAVAEGSVLYMPTTLPGISVSRASAALQRQDSLLAAIPEVESVFGKAGRASTATDPAGLDMFETTITLKPEEEWREGMTMERLIDEMDAAVRFPGITNSWTMPIKGRIDMLATGIRTPVGIKIFGPDLATLERIGRQIESAVNTVPGTRSVFAERAVSGYYLDIDIDRAAAARYGLNVEDIQAVVSAAIGGRTITETVEGRERYGVRLRYPHELRDQPEKLAEVLIPLVAGRGEASGAQVPLGQVATIREVSGPMAIKTEGAFPTAWVFVDVTGRDIGSYVTDARNMVEEMVDLPAGYTLQWSGQFEYMQRAKEKLRLVVPATLLIILLLLYLNFKSIGETLIVMLSLPFALVGGVLIMWLLGYNWSVATAIGFVALAGVAAEIGVVMLVYLGHAFERHSEAGQLQNPEHVLAAVREGAGQRLRPVIMTATAVIGGLLPILWGHGTGASVMKRIAAPMVGGMVSATILILLVIPVVYSLWKERSVAGRGASDEPHNAVPEAVETEYPLGV
jgi:Cu(I)/Ag(I) efflux system membrane protein CusA/SilA